MWCPSCESARFTHRAWLPCKPFRAVYCANCGEAFSAMPRPLELLWERVLHPFWNGAIRVER